MAAHERISISIKHVFKYFGPGFVAGASDEDPAGIGTYVQSGALFGYAQLWIALFSFPCMTVVQEMCGRIGMVTGQGLAAVIRNNYASPVVFFVVFTQLIVNAINIGADLGAMAESATLLCPLPYRVLLIGMTLAMATLIVLAPYRKYATYLKFLGLVLLTYVAAACTVHADWRRVMSYAFIPHLQWNKAFALMLVAVFGVTISPYEFFWQSSEEVEELVEQHKIKREEASRPKTTLSSARSLRYDTIFGMFFSNVIMFSVIMTAAATLHAHGNTEVQSAAQAARALGPVAGSFTLWLFVVGIVSSGLLSIPVMAASSAYAVAGAFGWPRSLGQPFCQEKRFYGIIIASCLVGLLVNATRIPPFKMLYYAGILNGIASPPLLFLITRIASDRKIMGEFTNSPMTTFVGWFLCAFMTLALLASFML